MAEKTFLAAPSGDCTVTRHGVTRPDGWPLGHPVATCAATTASLDSYYGEAMALGERTPGGPLDFAASARLAVGGKR
ncbi:hypothetical protein ACNKHS_15475 [Shigella flexneri]